MAHNRRCLAASSINASAAFVASGNGASRTTSTVLPGLQAVHSLQRHHRQGDGTPVKPVAEAVVETLPHLTRHVAGIVRCLTGMRCGEAVRDACLRHRHERRVWLYRPTGHKTAHHGTHCSGSEGGQAVEDFLTLDTQAYLFSPARQGEERYVAMREKRKTPIEPIPRSAAEKRACNRANATRRWASTMPSARPLNGSTRSQL